MSNIDEVLALQQKYGRRQHTDPIFHARTTLIRNVLATLQDMGRLDPKEDGGYSAYIVAAALYEAMPMEIQAEAWDEGMLAAKLQAEGIRTNVKNPYRKDDHEEADGAGAGRGGADRMFRP